jgi:hypothetical protein
LCILVPLCPPQNCLLAKCKNWCRIKAKINSTFLWYLSYVNLIKAEEANPRMNKQGCRRRPWPSSQPPPHPFLLWPLEGETMLVLTFPDVHRDWRVVFCCCSLPLGAEAWFS